MAGLPALWSSSNEGSRRLAPSLNPRGRADTMAIDARVCRIARGHRDAVAPTTDGRSAVGEDCWGDVVVCPSRSAPVQGTPGPRRRVPAHGDRSGERVYHDRGLIQVLHPRDASMAQVRGQRRRTGMQRDRADVDATPRAGAVVASYVGMIATVSPRGDWVRNCPTRLRRHGGRTARDVHVRAERPLHSPGGTTMYCVGGVQPSGVAESGRPRGRCGPRVSVGHASAVAVGCPVLDDRVTDDGWACGEPDRARPVHRPWWGVGSGHRA